ncbi:MmgE/PrpD family protein [uncultured Aeromicrobium sp.]|uniref:MmgE/PrpD family protein n=1 Tax=uncultured Aeromicrobium sp. TaxID=337820 RepID=UPI0025E084E9|nr:MmgE/PrpD family protein [uncultured Aeromicrobium sp.]
MTALLRLARYAESIDLAKLPAAVVDRLGALWLDHLGTVLGGAVVPEAQTIARLVAQRGATPVASVVGAGFSTSEPDAAFCNGAAADVLEHQDGYRFGGFHPSHTMPALLAVAESRDTDLRALFEASVVAYEVANRLGRAAHPEATQRGWFPPAAAYGAAAGCARLLGLPSEAIAQAVGTACFLAPGIPIDAIFAGPTSKPAFAGQLARTGVEASLLAAGGLTGWQETLDGPRGLVNLLGGDAARLADLVDDLKNAWSILDVHQKRYAGCRHTHGAIEAALHIAQDGLRPHDVAAIEVETYAVAKQLVDRPVTAELTTIGATLSLPYTVAVAIMDGEVGGRQYTPERVHDPDVAQLAGKVRIRVSEELEARYPEFTATRVVVTTADGGRHEHTVQTPAGDYRAPLTRQQLLDKFTGYAAPLLGEHRCEEVAELLLTARTDIKVRDLVGRLTVPNEVRRV